MAVSYKKLWKLLIDRDMKKKDLCAAAGISHASMAKLGKNENVTTDVLVKICTALQCDIGDIMESTPEISMKRRRVHWLNKRSKKQFPYRQSPY